VDLLLGMFIKRLRKGRLQSSSERNGRNWAGGGQCTMGRSWHFKIPNIIF